MASSRDARRCFRGAAWAIVSRALGVAALAAWCVAGDTAPIPPALPDAEWPPFRLEMSTRCAEYDVRVWASADETAPSYYRVVTIERDGVVLRQHDWAVGLGSLTGSDIDGNGRPNAIVECYSGGAHCCFVTYVYDVGDDLVSVGLPPSPGGNVEPRFVDLDDDGVYEVLTADDSFAYLYCCYAETPFVRVVLEYDAGARRYVPASPAYPHLYVDEIALDTERAAAAGFDGSGWDGTPKCEVLPLVLDYLYSGCAEAAWQALDMYYPLPDRETFRSEIESIVNGSPYFSIRK